MADDVSTDRHAYWVEFGELYRTGTRTYFALAAHWSAATDTWEPSSTIIGSLTDGATSVDELTPVEARDRFPAAFKTD